MTQANIVLDTNIVLDLFVFQDPLAEPLRQALQQRRLHWLATAAMREELARVLTYPQIARRLTHQHNRVPGAMDAQTSPQPGATHQAGLVLARFDARVSLLPVATKARVTCRDPDDQKFIDLAVAHQSLLLSKDKAVLCMKKRLLALGVQALAAINLD